MSTGLVDTTVIVHYLRRHPACRAWIAAQAARLSLTAITWLEVMEGATSKTNQARCKVILGLFDLRYLTVGDQQWAFEQLEYFQFSHRIGMNDCLIAAVAQRLNLPLYTHNLKHFTPLLGDRAIKPY